MALLSIATLLISIISACVFSAIIFAVVCLPTPGLPVITNLSFFNQPILCTTLFIHEYINNRDMRTCESCSRVRFYSLNFLFSKTTCNECYLDERKAEQALALYAAAFSAEFRITLKLIATADAKFGFSLKCLPFKWRQLWRRHHFCGRRRLDSLVHICDSTARLERVIYVRHQLWFFFAPFFL